MNDTRPTELAVQIAALRAGTAPEQDGFSDPPSEPYADALARALAAERRLESLVRLATAIVPAQHASDRPPSAWRAFIRELSRAKRHLSRARSCPNVRRRPHA